MFHPRYVTLKDGRAALIRFAEPRDAEALIDQINEVGAEEVYIMTERFSKSVGEEEEFLRNLDRRETLFLVAVLDGRLVGSADVCRGAQSKNAHTASLGVAIRKEVRGLGLGRAMLEEMIRWAKSVGVRKLTLGVFATNESAIALYQQLGFAEEARLKGQVVLQGRPVDELLMALWL